MKAWAAAADSRAERAIKAITQALRTGKIGDGNVFGPPKAGTARACFGEQDQTAL
ncbi:MAG: hypothetical protein D6766_00230 [Verrucomicrobia bacterium]|nr:MAG: hypothetical protein D6766_00230 [Verrucomicrobiota bacterium]